MSTPRTMIGIDHPVVAVRDMSAARLAYERLGFTVPPRGSHVQWGTGNWCIMFPDTYLELRGIIKPGETHNLGQFLESRGEGLMGMAFGTDDAKASRRALAERGFHPQAVKELTRNFELEEGWVQPQFSLCFLDEAETAGLMSVVFCQHLTPELIRRPEWLAHTNGARGVSSVTGVVADLDAAAETHRRLFGPNAVLMTAGRVRIDTGRGYVSLCTSEELARAYPEWPQLTPVQDRLVAVTLWSERLASTEQFLRSQAIGYHQGAAGSLIVHPGEACNVIIEFTDHE